MNSAVTSGPRAIHSEKELSVDSSSTWENEDSRTQDTEKEAVARHLNNILGVYKINVERTKPAYKAFVQKIPPK